MSITRLEVGMNGWLGGATFPLVPSKGLNIIAGYVHSLSSGVKFPNSNEGYNLQ